MKKLTNRYAIDRDIIDAVTKAGKLTNYTSEQLRGYIVEYAYKRHHNIPFEVAIQGKSDDGFDFIKDGKKYDIKATRCKGNHMDAEGYTAWSLTLGNVHEDTNYILCRTNWLKGAMFATVEECYEVSSEELTEVCAPVCKGEVLYEFMHEGSKEVMHSNRDCLVCTNKFLDCYLNGEAKIVRDGIVDGGHYGVWLEDVNYAEYRKLAVAGLDLSAVSELSELNDNAVLMYGDSIVAIREPGNEFRAEYRAYVDKVNKYAESVAANDQDDCPDSPYECAYGYGCYD